MPIDKDLRNIYTAMVKTTYKPIIKRAIVLLLIGDMDRMQAGMRLNDLEFFDILRSTSGKKAVVHCLELIERRSQEIINEILLQYGLHQNDGEMIDFYHESMEREFMLCVRYVGSLIARGRYDLLDVIARTQP